jgi:hypothetical protein
MMKAFLTAVLLVSIFSCTTNTPEPQSGVIVPDFPPAVNQEALPFPGPVQITVPAPGPAVPAAGGDEDGFDPRSISREEFEDARVEIELLVEEINRVIRANDYTKWLTYLSDDFIATINSPEFLDRISKTSRQLSIQKIVLKTPRDYFIQVVVAARKNISMDAHLDDIEFSSHNRVKAYTVKGNQRLRLFEFVRSNGTWKLALSS